jgi:hypothetical protein
MGYGIVFWTIAAFAQGSVIEIGNAYPTPAACRIALQDWYPIFRAWPESNVVFDCWPQIRRLGNP